MKSESPSGSPSSGSPLTPAELRRRALRVLSGQDRLSGTSSADSDVILHELRVHQIELEMQNEELRRAHLELTQFKNQYEDLFEFAPMGYLVLDEHSVIHQCNFAACALFGVERSLLVGRRLLSFLTPADQETWVAHFLKVSENPDWRHVCQVKIAFGSRVTVLRLESTGLRSGNDFTASRCRTALVDISAELEVERWKQQAILLQQILEHLPAGAVFVEGERVQLNRAAEQICGYSRSEIGTRKAWYSKLYGDRQQEMRELCNTLRAEGFRNLHPPVPIRHKDGTQRMVQFAAHVIDRHEIWLLHDVTDLIHVQAELRRTQFSIDHSQEAILWIQQDGELSYANAAAQHFGGVTAQELHAMVLRELGPPRHPQPGESASRQWICPREDGGTRFFEATMEWMQYDDEIFACVFLRDVSSQRRAEWEQTLALELNQLRIAQELHDSFGSLLTGIDCLASGLAKALDRQGIRFEVARAEEISEQVREAIVQLRHLVKGLHPLGSDPNQFAQALRALATRIRAQGKIKCRYVPSPEALPALNPKVANQVFRIAQEACHNAVRHSGGTHLTVTLKCVGEELILTVTDNGRGFEIEEPRQGGFGLRTMEHRARSIGGHLTIANRPSGGTRVTCWVPRACADSVEELLPDAVPAP